MKFKTLTAAIALIVSACAMRALKMLPSLLAVLGLAVVAVAPGQEVKAGEALAVVEAMKMENVLRAERDGRVAHIRANPGDTLAVDQVILEFE